MAPTLQVKLNGGPAQAGKVTAAVGDVVQPTAPVNEIASWRSPVARWRIIDFPPSMTEPAGWSTASEGAITYYYFDGNEQPPPFNVVEFGPHMLDLAATAADGSRETTRTTYVKVPNTDGVELIGYGEPVYTWVKTAQADARAVAEAVASAAPLPTGTITIPYDASDTTGAGFRAKLVAALLVTNSIQL
ncbi:MAG: hypothetical protein HOW73_20645, partial [Polyangiaceae bacterium]|nr:hypothetical protein [Polyangiaceae bacterium]